ncbi:MAG: divergent polysaccharide deacetylase family protein [Rhodospirillales bacterium]|nr:divergent polysaccharide deacetylase family protein [Rhodospirillales bacterium]
MRWRIRKHKLGGEGRSDGPRIHPLAGLSLVLAILVGGTAAWLLWAAPATNRQLASLGAVEVPIEKLPPGAQPDHMLPPTPAGAPVVAALVQPAPLQTPPVPKLDVPVLGQPRRTAEVQPEAAPPPGAAPAPATTTAPGTPPGSIQVTVPTMSNVQTASVLPPAAPLPAAPVAELVEQTPAGPLPKIGADGRAPWRVYGRPADTAEKRPRVAIVVTGLGLGNEATQAAIKLNAEATLAFAPFADRLKLWVEQARGAGHEVLLSVPMEPNTYPKDDPGPQTLLTSATETDNTARLTSMLTRASGYVGIINSSGSRFQGDTGAMKPILTQLRQRGLLYVELRTATQSAAPPLAAALGLPYANVDRVLDSPATRAAVDLALAELEGTARHKGFAIGVISPHPAALERLAAWFATLPQKGIVAVPVSAVAAPAGPAPVASTN